MLSCYSLFSSSFRECRKSNMSTLAALPKVSNKKTSGVDIWIILAVVTGIVVITSMVSMHNINNTKQQMGSSFSTSDNFNK